MNGAQRSSRPLKRRSQAGVLDHFDILDRAKRVALSCAAGVTGGRLQPSIPNHSESNEARRLQPAGAPTAATGPGLLGGTCTRRWGWGRVPPPGPSAACSFESALGPFWRAHRAWTEDCLRYLRARSCATQEALTARLSGPRKALRQQNGANRQQ